MRFDVNRICELAGLGAASGGLMSEAAAAPAPAKPAASGAKAPAAPPAKPMPAAKAAPPAKAVPPAKAAPVTEDDYTDTDEGNYEGDHYEMAGAHDDIMDEEMYEIDEYALMEALVDMRQRRLEESNVRDAVRDEIKRALSDRSGSWVYGANKPTGSKAGQVSRGGFGIGFGFRR